MPSRIWHFVNGVADGPGINVGSVTTSGTVTQGGALALGTTPTLGGVFQNTTAAAAGAQQISPSVDWVGQGWKTDATAASQEVRFRADVLPVQGSAAPSGTWRLGKQIAGGAIAYPLTVTSAGVGTFLGALAVNGGDPTLNDFVLKSRGGGFGMSIVGAGVSTAVVLLGPNSGAQGGRLTLFEGTGVTGNVVIDGDAASMTLGTDVVLSRAAANRLMLASGDAWNLAPTAFASLPTGAEGDMACVTDSNTATWGATIAGGGANNVLAFFNGTNWTVAGA